MQTIPSRDPSTTNLASSPPQQELTASQPPETPRSTLDARRRADYTNGDAIDPAVHRFPGPGAPNGAYRQAQVAQLDDTQPSLLESRPVEKPPEVDLPCNHVSSQLLTMARSNVMLKGSVYLLHPTMTFSGPSKKQWQGEKYYRPSWSYWLIGYSETEQPQFKLDIRNEPIREEDGDAQTALSNVANTLRVVGISPCNKRSFSLM